MVDVSCTDAGVTRSSLFVVLLETAQNHIHTRGAPNARTRCENRNAGGVHLAIIGSESWDIVFVGDQVHETAKLRAPFTDLVSLVIRRPIPGELRRSPAKPEGRAVEAVLFSMGGGQTVVLWVK